MQTGGDNDGDGDDATFDFQLNIPEFKREKTRSVLPRPTHTITYIHRYTDTHIPEG